ncbi:SRPBCC family protein [Acidimicrobiia bacterium EGI L10123]|uniref:SRPBCC family protein n=1 Tax=Salinilacustrithrix flava TaxID=2957203 RepID=UPI003D7C2BB8|nr:SRPBCC family protein [Acidimicrobiia bacterium EGI L10123]
MARITVSTTIDASPAAVWAAVEDVGSHVDWMADAEAIRFTSDRTSGVGTTFECDTKVGPLRLTDLMEITRWEPEQAMGVRHVGLVTGEGVFTLSSAGEQSPDRATTRFEWSERLVFPWWMGGPVGGIVGGRIMRLIWKRNLRRLKGIVEGQQG